jgi:hypothetical protein
MGIGSETCLSMSAQIPDRRGMYEKDNDSFGRGRGGGDIGRPAAGAHQPGSLTRHDDGEPIRHVHP